MATTDRLTLLRRAIAVFEAALATLDGDPTIAARHRPLLRTAIEAQLADLRAELTTLTPPTVGPGWQVPLKVGRSGYRGGSIA